MDLNASRVVEPVEGYKLAQSLGFNAYYEVSAIENININKPIEDLIQSIYFVNNMSVDSN
jgi:Ras family